MVRLHIGALVVQGEPFFDSRRDHIVELAAREGIPAIYAWRDPKANPHIQQSNRLCGLKHAVLQHRLLAADFL